MRIYSLKGFNELDQNICNAVEDFFSSTEEKGVYDLGDHYSLRIEYDDPFEDEVTAVLTKDQKIIRDFCGKESMWLTSELTGNPIIIRGETIQFDREDSVRNVYFHNCTFRDIESVTLSYCHFTECTTEPGCTINNIQLYNCLFDKCNHYAKATLVDVTYSTFIDCNILITGDGTNNCAYNKVINCTFTCKKCLSNHKDICYNIYTR